MNDELDVYVEYHGSIVQFEIRTDEARAWVNQNVHSEGHNWMGNRLCVETRYAYDLRQGMQLAGLNIT